jgi:chitin disaccharide deacetylase
MSAKKTLIVNADDFGQSRGVNRGISEAHEHGIVNSASLMVRWPAAAEAATYARDHPRLSLGLHLDFGEWACRDGTWMPLYRVVDESDATAVAAELARQLDAFHTLISRPPSHLDSHQHAHRQEPARSIVAEVARTFDIPLRHFCAGVRYCGRFYGQDDEGRSYPDGISVEGLIALLKGLPAGSTELGCHPALGHDLETMYRAERAEEVRTLCNPRVRAALADLGIELGSFADVVDRSVIDS